MTFTKVRQNPAHAVGARRRSGLVNTSAVIAMVIVVSAGFAAYSGRMADFIIGAGASLSASGIWIAARITRRRRRRPPPSPDDESTGGDGGIGG